MMNIYLSHPIRGLLKDKATQEDMDRNCEIARQLGRQLREAMEFIGVDIYVPADHEEFVKRAYKHGLMSVENILRIDCMIIREKYNDLLLIYAPYGPPVEGCSIEKNCAEENNIPVVIFKDFRDAVEKLKPYVTKWAEFKGEK